MTVINAALADIFEEISELCATASKIYRGSPEQVETQSLEVLPEYFEGKNLTPKGVDFIYSLFDRNLNRYQISRILDVSYTAVNYRYQQWLQRKRP